MASLTVPPCSATPQSFSSKGTVKMRQPCVAEFGQLSHVTNSNRNMTPRQRPHASPRRPLRTQRGTHRWVIYEGPVSDVWAMVSHTSDAAPDQTYRAAEWQAFADPPCLTPMLHVM